MDNTAKSINVVFSTITDVSPANVVTTWALTDNASPSLKDASDMKRVSARTACLTISWKEEFAKLKDVWGTVVATARDVQRNTIWLMGSASSRTVWTGWMTNASLVQKASGSRMDFAWLPLLSLVHELFYDISWISYFDCSICIFLVSIELRVNLISWWKWIGIDNLE
jgi:hypothetical protein